ncbi:MAG TPA: RNA 2'-phosphotransferase [Candidatus Binatia bacterium]
MSRFLSYLLRHRPGDYPLAFDERGFVPLEDLLQTVRDRFPGAVQADVLGIVEDPHKMRFEFRDGKVRATYGHSFPVNFDQKKVAPPLCLYQGVARDLAENLLNHGLRPCGRQYVHLSLSAEDAIDVGKRGDAAPAVLVVDAEAAHASGIAFYQSGPLYLAGEIPPRFLSMWDPENA